VVIDRGEIRKRRKAPSKQFREDFGHTPLSIEEDIPWKCARLVIGTGACSSLPVMNGVKQADVFECPWTRHFMRTRPACSTGSLQAKNEACGYPKIVLGLHCADRIKKRSAQIISVDADCEWPRDRVLDSSPHRI